MAEKANSLNIHFAQLHDDFVHLRLRPHLTELMRMLPEFPQLSVLPSLSYYHFDLFRVIHNCIISDDWDELLVILHHLSRIVTCYEENITAHPVLILTVIYPKAENCLPSEQRRSQALPHGGMNLLI